MTCDFVDDGEVAHLALGGLGGHAVDKRARVMRTACCAVRCPAGGIVRVRQGGSLSAGTWQLGYGLSLELVKPLAAGAL